jgi:hypothetical protein
MERIGSWKGLVGIVIRWKVGDRHGGEESLNVIMGMGPNREQRSLTQLTHDVNSTKIFFTFTIDDINKLRKPDCYHDRCSA